MNVHIYKLIILWDLIGKTIITIYKQTMKWEFHFRHNIKNVLSEVKNFWNT